MSNETPASQLVLVSGVSNTGKSASLINIRDQKDWLYMNTESGKHLPFQNNFNQGIITDPYQVHDSMEWAIGEPDIKGIVIDSMTFLMDMFNTKYIYGAADGRAAWNDYQHFFKHIMQDLVPRFNRPVVIMAHTRTDIDERGNSMTSVPISGALKNVGVESYFSTVVSTKVVDLKELDNYKNDMLTITEDDEILGYKHVFQTRLTKKTIGERIRSPIGFFSANETYINNDVQLLLDYLSTKYSNN